MRRFWRKSFLMSERRPHWDDDLVDGVGRRLIPLYRSIGYCTDAERHRIYTLIEFVEDWMDANDNPLPHVLNECLQWLDAERAAIQRVRELHHPIPGFNGTQWCGAHCEATADGDPTEYPCETIRALDGGAE